MALESFFTESFLNQSISKILGEVGPNPSTPDLLFFLLFAFFIGLLSTTLIYTILPKTKERYFHWRQEDNYTKTIISLFIGVSSLFSVMIFCEFAKAINLLVNGDVLPNYPYMFLGALSVGYVYFFHLVYDDIKKYREDETCFYLWILSFIAFSFLLSLNLALFGSAILLFFNSYCFLGIMSLLIVVLLDFMAATPFLIKKYYRKQPGRGFSKKNKNEG